MTVHILQNLIKRYKIKRRIAKAKFIVATLSRSWYSYPLHTLQLCMRSMIKSKTLDYSESFRLNALQIFLYLVLNSCI